MVEGLEKTDQIRKKLEENIVNISKIARRVGAKGTEDALAQQLDHVTKEDFTISVIGEFKRGKSTLINAILGEKILPSKVAPCTGLITEIKYGETKKAELYKKDKSDKSGKFEERPAKILEERPGSKSLSEQIREYIVIPEDAENDDDETDKLPQTKKLDYDLVRLYWPLPLCKNHVTLVDSPGLNEDNDREEIVKGYYDKIDAAIFVLSCDQFLSKTEQDYIQNPNGLISYIGKQFFIVANRCDEITKNAGNDLDDDDCDSSRNAKAQELQAREELKKRAGKYLPQHLGQQWQKRFFFVSAKNILLKKMKGTVAEEYDFPKFVECLIEFLAKDRFLVKMDPISKKLNHIIETIKKENLVQKEILDKSKLEELEKKEKEIQKPLERLHRQKGNVLATIDREKSSMDGRTRNSLRIFCRSLVYELKSELDSLPLPNFSSVGSNQNCLNKDIIPALQSFITRQIRDFLENNLKEEMRRSIETIKDKAKEEISDFQEELNNLRTVMYGDQISNFEEIDIDWSGVIGSSLASLGVVLATVLTGVLNPWIAIPAGIAWIAKEVFSKSSKAEQEFKEKVFAQVRDKTPQIGTTIESKVLAEISEVYQRVSQKISEILERMVTDQTGQLEQAKKDKLEEQEKVNQKQQEIEDKNQKYEDYRKTLYEIRIDIESLISQI